VEHFFEEQFRVIQNEELDINAVEGHVYFAWSVGSGKVVLLEEVVQT